MANELTVNTKIAWTLSSDSRNFTNNTYIDVSGSVREGGVQTIGTTEESINIGDLTNVGVLFIQNLENDGGNFVQIGGTTGNYTVRQIGRAHV